MKTSSWAFGVALAGCAALLGACAVAGGGSSGGAANVLLCGPGGACPTGMTCNANNVCVQAAAGGADAGTAAADSGMAAADATGAKDGGKVDAVTATNDTALPDVAPIKDTSTVETTADAPVEITDAPVAPVPATIAGLQTAAASLQCEKPDGIASYGKVILEPAVVTGPMQSVSSAGGKKSTLFFARPATGPVTADNAGMAFIVGTNPLQLAPGDVVQVTGTAAEFYCQTEIMVESVEGIVQKGKVAAPEPYLVPISAVFANPEPYEDVLLRVSGVVVDNPNAVGSDGKFHGEFTVASGSATLRVAVGPGSQYYDKDAKTKFTAGTKFASIAGHLTYSFGNFLLRPRDDADLQVGF
ncbi:MAG: hypothetical protein FJ100_10790 [Deltaproteobacteria bacterium]|nr:hypothetical protein [Deltaproteobacteria bacterium]